MALDHYISQVHLKRFCAENTGNRLHALRKSGMKYFIPRTKDVCRIDEGNTNNYLREPRAIEEFLKAVEGNYNLAISNFEAGKPDNQSIYVIAGFVSYVMTCSPAAMRIASAPLKGAIEGTARILDRMGLLPPPPKELGEASLTKLIEGGRVIFDVDPKYPQAIGIENVLSQVALFGNFHWEILKNDHRDSYFFTSDYPVAIEPSQDIRVLNRVIPLTPTTALRIHPNANIRRKNCDFTFRNFSFAVRRASRGEAININRLLVRSAEDVVFFHDLQSWIEKFIQKKPKLPH